MFCPKCGTDNTDSKFCINCGNPLTATNEYIDSNQSILNSKSSFLKNFTQGFSWLILAVFIFQGDFLPKSILLMLTKNTLSSIWNPIISIFTYAGVILILLVFIKATANITINLKNYLKALVSSLGSLLFIWGAFSAFGLIVGNLYKLVVEFGMDSPTKGLIILLGFVLLLIMLQMLLIGALMNLYLTLRYSINFFQTGKTFRIVLAWILKNIGKMILINLGLSLGLVCIFFVQDFGNNLLRALVPYGFMETFLKYVLASVLTATILSVIFTKASKIADDKNIVLMEIKESNKKSIPILPIISIILGIGLIFTFPLQPRNPISKYNSEIQGYMVRGDIYKDSGYINAAIHEYDLAMSRLLALQGFLLNQKGIEMDSQEFTSQGNQKFTSAYNTDQLNPYISLFMGKIALNNNEIDKSIGYLTTGARNPLFVEETYLTLLHAYKVKDDKIEQKDTLDWLLRNEVFHDVYDSLSKSSIKKIDKWLSELDLIFTELEPKMAYKYFEMASFNGHNEALTGLLPLSEKYKDNTEIQYMVTQIYAEYRQEQSNYPKLIQAVESFSDSFDSNIDPKTYLEKETYMGQMYMTTNDLNKAESIYKELYERYPDSIESADSYMYVLIKNQKFEEALIIAENMVEDQKTLTTIYQHALCLLNLNRHLESLDIIKNVGNFSTPYTEEYDRYLYAYSLAYTNSIKTQEHFDIIETELGDDILKYYILAMKGWRDKDSETSTTNLRIVLEKDNSLGYAWYCLGINLYEQSVRTSSGDFQDAIDSYLKSLQILPDHVEGFFSLAHCYNKADMKLEALRAFRKVIDLVPYEDHRVDPYGMVVHSAGEINRLQQELGTGVQ